MRRRLFAQGWRRDDGCGDGRHGDAKAGTATVGGGGCDNANADVLYILYLYVANQMCTVQFNSMSIAFNEPVHTCKGLPPLAFTPAMTDRADGGPARASLCPTRRRRGPCGGRPRGVGARIPHAVGGGSEWVCESAGVPRRFLSFSFVIFFRSSPTVLPPSRLPDLCAWSSLRLLWRV